MILDSSIVSAISQLQQICADMETAKGFNDDFREILNILSCDPSLQKVASQAFIAQKLCLSHSELSEGLEGMRKDKMDDHLPHRPMLEVEIADAIIRLMSLGGYARLDIAGAVEEKLEYNSKRPHKHGKNF